MALNGFNLHATSYESSYHTLTHTCTHTLHNTKQCTVASIEMMKTQQLVVRSQIGNKHFYVANRHFPVSCGDTT